jgi:hypothetical protein
VKLPYSLKTLTTCHPVTVSHHRTLESSAVPLREPQTLYVNIWWMCCCKVSFTGRKLKVLSKLEEMAQVLSFRLACTTISSVFEFMCNLQLPCMSCPIHYSPIIIPFEDIYRWCPSTTTQLQMMPLHNYTVTDDAPPQLHSYRWCPSTTTQLQMMPLQMCVLSERVWSYSHCRWWYAGWQSL